MLFNTVYYSSLFLMYLYFCFSRFYICCDKCEDWLHGTCVGVLPCESESMDDYICPKCMPDSEINFANLNPLNEQDNGDLMKLVKQIQVIIIFIQP